MPSRQVFQGVLLSICLLTAGCGRSGPVRYQLSGTVEFNGEPIPVGFIYFSPDTTKGNSGPGSGTEIKDGQYKTLPGKGVVGGPMIVRIDGYDGVSTDVGGETLQNGMALFEAYEIQVDIEKQNGTKDFEFEKAATGPQKSFDPSNATLR